MRLAATILYIEDHDDSREIFSDFLKRRVDHVITAKNGDEGLSKYIIHNPDLVITDIKMPVKNGIELINDIRKTNENIPIIVVSAFSGEEIIKESIKEKVDAYLSKPIDKIKFSEIIESSLKKYLNLKTDNNLYINNKNEKLKNKDLTIVGVGASAGGLEALSSFIKGLPKNSDYSYIIAQHLSPSHETLLVEILSKRSEIYVKDAEHQEDIKANIIYISPPNKNIEISSDNKIILSDIEKNSIYPKPSINKLFKSIAQIKKQNSIGIILSGTGSDGTEGLKDININGGVTIVQEPEDAKYDGMPKSAIERDSIHIITKASLIGEELVALANFPRDKVFNKYQINISNSNMSVIYDSLYKYSKVDFSVYKESTINRRIERRMLTLKINTLDEYVTHLIENENEVEFLFKDILIGVTSFFRDIEAFNSLKEELEKYILENENLSEFRVWIPGCSTGEETYSILFLLSEIIKEKDIVLDLKIFATDIDKEALKIARKGCFEEESLSEINKERVFKYFINSNNKYEVKKVYRENIVFSIHNLLSDPPFKNIDLIVCRNLLIYFNLEAQKHIMPMLHYSLNDNGVLFLGKSENITGFENLFAPIDKKNKIFKHITSTKKSYAIDSLKTSSKQQSIHHTIEAPITIKKPLHEQVIVEAAKIIMPNIVVTNEQMEIIYKKGDLKYLKMPDGYVSYNLYKMLDPKLALDLKTLTNQAKLDNKIVSTPYIPMGNKEANSINYLRVYIVPLLDRRNPNYIYYFSELNKDDLPILNYIENNQKIDSNPILEMELLKTKEHMQALIEEIEKTNEELQSTNEELQSSNEELQSTNEELETSNEELQSTNEELQTAYSELKELYSSNNTIKEKLQNLNYQYESLLDNINDAVVISNIDGIFLRVNKSMESLCEYSKEQLLTKSWDEISIEPAKKIFKNLNKKLIEDGKTEPSIFKIVSKMGNVKIITMENYLIKDEDSLKIWTFASDITKITLFQDELALSEKKYKITFDEANIGIAHVALNGQWLSVNKKLCEFFEYSQEELKKKTFQEITHEEDIDLDLANMQKLLKGEISTYKMQKRYITKNGKTIWGNLSVALVKDDLGNPEYFISIIEDINEIKSLLDEKEQSQVVYNSTQEGIMVTDKNTVITSINPAFEEITGYSKNDVIGKKAGFLKSFKHPKEFYDNMWRSIKFTGLWSGEIFNRTKSGEVYPAFLNINAVKDNKGQIKQYIGVLTDISLLKQSQDKIQYLANHDTLTKLPNRNLLNDRLEHALEKAKRKEENIALFFIDLDRFKIVNDGLGHDIGDEVLIEVANRLKKALRQQDTVARLGGDEFIAVVEGLESPISAGKIAQNMINTISENIQIDTHKISIGASIGISIYPNDGLNIEELFRHADIAMYDAKENGKNTYRFTNKELSTGAFEKATMENAIREGLNNEEFEVHYQPIINVQTNKISHFEALIRWKHPKLGMVHPNKFIPLAEESSLIVSLTEFVFFKVVEDLKYLNEKFNSSYSISINFSVKDFEDDKLFHTINKYLRNQKLDKKSIILEMTERKFMLDNKSMKEKVEQYKKLGLEFAIDDFGTGYSNLSNLSEFPIDYLKIDRSYVSKIGKNKKSEEIIKATIAIAKALGFKTIAEGIENKDENKFLIEQGCNFLQGYLHSHPKPLDELEPFIKEHLENK